MTSDLSPPDAIRSWFIAHPGQFVRPADLAAQIGRSVHQTANTVRRLLDTEEVVRVRPTTQVGRSGPGVRYGSADPYKTATSLDEWTKIRAQIVANQKGARTP